MSPATPNFFLAEIELSSITNKYSPCDTRIESEERLRTAWSSFLLALLISSTLVCVFNIEPARAAGTIYIRADGSIDPPTANITSADNVTYTFTDNNYDEIVVERSNINNRWSWLHASRLWKWNRFQRV